MLVPLVTYIRRIKVHWSVTQCWTCLLSRRYDMIATISTPETVRRRVLRIRETIDYCTLEPAVVRYTPHVYAVQCIVCLLSFDYNYFVLLFVLLVIYAAASRDIRWSMVNTSTTLLHLTAHGQHISCDLTCAFHRMWFFKTKYNWSFDGRVFTFCISSTSSVMLFGCILNNSPVIVDFYIWLHGQHVSYPLRCG